MNAKTGEPFHYVNEKRTGAARRVEHAHVSRRACERRSSQLLDQNLRRVERARRFSIGPCHETFECFTQHLGIDGRFGPDGAILAGGESVSRQKLGEYVA